MTDDLQCHKLALDKLKALLGKDHAKYRDVLQFEYALMDIVKQEAAYGSNDSRRSERRRIVGQLNNLALEAQVTSFTDLYDEAEREAARREEAQRRQTNIVTRGVPALQELKEDTQEPKAFSQVDFAESVSKRQPAPSYATPLVTVKEDLLNKLKQDMDALQCYVKGYMQALPIVDLCERIRSELEQITKQTDDSSTGRSWEQIRKDVEELRPKAKELSPPAGAGERELVESLAVFVANLDEVVKLVREAMNELLSQRSVDPYLVSRTHASVNSMVDNAVSVSQGFKGGAVKMLEELPRLIADVDLAIRSAREVKEPQYPEQPTAQPQWTQGQPAGKQSMRQQRALPYQGTTYAPGQVFNTANSAVRGASPPDRSATQVPRQRGSATWIQKIFGKRSGSVSSAHGPIAGAAASEERKGG
jgi:hypothetical protein